MGDEVDQQQRIDEALEENRLAKLKEKKQSVSMTVLSACGNQRKEQKEKGGKDNGKKQRQDG